MLAVASLPLVTGLPAASSIVAVSLSVLPEAELVTTMLYTISLLDALPILTVSLRVLLVVAVLLRVPLAWRFTGPARLPVIVLVATPAAAVGLRRRVTEPDPLPP